MLQLTVLAVKKEPNKICPKMLLNKVLFNMVIPRSGLGKLYPARITYGLDLLTFSLSKKALVPIFPFAAK